MKNLYVRNTTDVVHPSPPAFFNGNTPNGILTSNGKIFFSI